MVELLYRLYATFMMYGCVRDELKAMKEGLNDVIPPELLSGLTAEVCVINLSLVISSFRPCNQNILQIAHQSQYGLCPFRTLYSCICRTSILLALCLLNTRVFSLFALLTSEVFLFLTLKPRISILIF